MLQKSQVAVLENAPVAQPVMPVAPVDPSTEYTERDGHTASIAVETNAGQTLADPSLGNEEFFRLGNSIEVLSIQASGSWCENAATL